MGKFISVVLIGILLALMMLITGFTKKDASRQTEAEGWTEHAIQFWEKQLSE